MARAHQNGRPARGQAPGPFPPAGAAVPSPGRGLGWPTDMSNPFDFLDPLAELEAKIAALEQASQTSGVNMGPEIISLREKLTRESRRTFAQLTPWQRVQLSRHPLRP